MIPCNFTSRWDDGSSITTACEYDPETGYVEPVITDIDPDGSLVEETIILKDGDEKKVCPECHEYVLRSVMVPDEVGKGLHEAFECPTCGEVE